MSRGERTFDDLAVGAGIAIGVAHRYDSRAIIQVRERKITTAKVLAEQHRVLEAAADASGRMNSLQEQAKRMPGAAREELGYMLDAYQLMLNGSRLVRGVQKRIATDRINAEAAVMREIGLMAEAFASMDDPYLAARIDDIREVGRRLVESLGKAAETGLEDLPPNAIIVADQLSPADTALLDPARVAGLATMNGGVESHTAIVARSLGLPAVVAAADFLSAVESGEDIILDGGTGKVIVAPTAATLTKYKRRRMAFVRTLDVGADKLGDLVGLAPGPNPALGLRAIRFSLTRRKLFLTQLSAILRVSAYGPVRILIPMVCTVDEVRTVRNIIARLVNRLRRRGVRLSDPLPPLGIMIEIPGAALSSDALAAEADFFAIGTNDLTQYTLAIDRTDDQVAYLYNPLHPAVLRLIQFSAEAAAAAGIPVSVCGEMAGDERLTPILLGFGITELSMAPTSLPRVKKRILDLNLSAIAGRVRRVTSESDPARLRGLLEELSGAA